MCEYVRVLCLTMNNTLGLCCVCVFFQAEDGIRDLVRSRGLGDVYKRQILNLIDALAEANPNHQHTIAIHSTNLQWISPRNIIKDTINFFNKDHAVLRNEANIHYKVIKRTIGMNPITGINYIQSLTNKHLKVIESLPSKPDLIHAHVSYPSLLIAQVISKKYNIPYILTEHSTRFPDRRFEDFGYSHDQIAEAFIACSATIAAVSYTHLTLPTRDLG